MINKIMTHKVFRYIFLLPILSLIILVGVYKYSETKFTENIISEKIIERELALDRYSTLVQYEVDHGIDFDKFKQAIAYTFDKLDQDEKYYGRMYEVDEDGNLIRIESEIYNPELNSLLNVRDYQEFKTAVFKHDSGRVKIHFSGDAKPDRDIYLVYSWVHVSDNAQEDILLAMGISHLSIEVAFFKEFQIMFIFMIIILTILNSIDIAVIMLAQHDYDKQHQNYVEALTPRVNGRRCYDIRSEGTSNDRNEYI